MFKSAKRLGYTAEPRGGLCCPSVDVFFDSASTWWTDNAIGILLTGMGNDGAIGLKALRSRHWQTIAQNEKSSAIYGMPKAAVALDAAVHVLAIEDIASKLRELLQ